MGSVTDAGGSKETRLAELRRSQDLWLEIRNHPVKFFMDQDRASRPGLPDLLSAAMTTFFWASALDHWEPWTHQRDTTQHHYANRHPLPVGRESLRQFMGWIDATHTAGYYGNPEFLLDLMPFDGEELAVCIIRATIEGTTVEAFGLCRIDAMASVDAVVYRMVDMQFRLKGLNPGHPDLAAFCRALRAWWATLAGKPVKLGRPKGTTRFDRAEVEAMLRVYLAGLPAGDVGRRSEFLASGAIPASTWNDWMREWDTSWTDLVRAVRAG